MKYETIMSDKQNLRGFRTLWIRFDGESVDKHQLFLKEHSVRNQEPQHPRGRTLFVLNIPPYVTADNLKESFSKLCGTASNVSFTAPKGFKSAYIVFERESNLEKALELPESHTITLNSDGNRCLTGLAKWCKEYNDSIRSEKEMKEEIEEYMNNYDRRVAYKLAQEKAMEEQEAEDAEGWVTVSGRKKRGEFALPRKESAIDKVHHKEEQKNKKKQLLNFYTFQIRESKKQNLAELRKKFELDKKRLQDLKSKRTFKPF